MISTLNTGVSTSVESIFENSKIVCEWLGTEKAAAFLDMTPNALRIMVHRGKVKVYRIGRRLRFKLTDLRALLQRKRG